MDIPTTYKKRQKRGSRRKYNMWMRKGKNKEEYEIEGKMEVQRR
jgi:hypothetical protein